MNTAKFENVSVSDIFDISGIGAGQSNGIDISHKKYVKIFWKEIQIIIINDTSNIQMILHAQSVINLSLYLIYLF